MEHNYILVEKQDSIATVTLNDPAKRNAFSQELSWTLADVLHDLCYDDEVRVVVISGAEGNFCGGGDVKAMKEKMDRISQGLPPAVNPYLNQEKMNTITSTIRNMPKPVIAKIQGAAAGAGVSLAMACDFSIAELGSTFLFAFVGIGLMPDMGCYSFLTQRVGITKATELFMLGKKFTGEQAAQWGIITEAVAPEQIDEKVTKLAKRLASGPSQAYAKIKSMLNQTVYPNLELSMRKEIEYQQQLNKTEDHFEAVASFLEKRAPVFKGK